VGQPDKAQGIGFAAYRQLMSDRGEVVEDFFDSAVGVKLETTMTRPP